MASKVKINFRERSPIQEQYGYLRGLRYEFDGLPGVGKSEFGKCAEYYLNQDGIKAKYFPEYVPRKFLNLYLKNDEYKKRYAASFQIIMAERRLTQTKEAIAFAENGGFAIVDGPLIRDTAFEHFLHTTKTADGEPFINDEEHDAYIEIMEEANGLVSPDEIVFFDASTETLRRRLKKRGGEQYTHEYLYGLRCAYDSIYDGIGVSTLGYNADCVGVEDRDHEVVVRFGTDASVTEAYASTIGVTNQRGLTRNWVYSVLRAVKSHEFKQVGLKDYVQEAAEPNWKAYLGV